MVEPPTPAHAPRRPEPPLIARARAIGWWLLAGSLALLTAARLSGGTIATVCQGAALACGLLGLLAIVNVALVRGLYRQIDTAGGDRQEDDAGGDRQEDDAGER